MRCTCGLARSADHSSKPDSIRTSYHRFWFAGGLSVLRESPSSRGLKIGPRSYSFLSKGTFSVTAVICSVTIIGGDITRYGALRSRWFPVKFEDRIDNGSDKPLIYKGFWGIV